MCGANGIRNAESPMAVNCKRCGNPVPAEKRECQACGEDNGFPNVRLAQEPAEVAELRNRLHNAEVSTTARHCKQVLDQFGTAVLGSKAVIARSLAVVQDLLENDRRTYTNYQRQLSSGARTAEDNDIDRVRTQFESALFPNFHEDILFACLSLNNRGVAAYGPYTMVLRENLIAHRTSVFQENLLTLSRRLGLLLHEPVPPGYRAEWAHRHTLAKAKLHSDIDANTSELDFPHILLKDRGATDNGDFVEVHVYGPLNKYTIERVVGPMPRAGENKLIWRRLERLLGNIGATLEAT